MTEQERVLKLLGTAAAAGVLVLGLAACNSSSGGSSSSSSGGGSTGPGGVIDLETPSEAELESLSAEPWSGTVLDAPVFPGSPEDSLSFGSVEFDPETGGITVDGDDSELVGVDGQFAFYEFEGEPDFLVYFDQPLADGPENFAGIGVGDGGDIQEQFAFTRAVTEEASAGPFVDAHLTDFDWEGVFLLSDEQLNVDVTVDTELTFDMGQAVFEFDPLVIPGEGTCTGPFRFDNVEAQTDGSLTVWFSDAIADGGDFNGDGPCLGEGDAVRIVMAPSGDMLAVSLNDNPENIADGGVLFFTKVDENGDADENGPE